jgi:hypothetical protein
VNPGDHGIVSHPERVPVLVGALGINDDPSIMGHAPRGRIRIGRPTESTTLGKEATLPVGLVGIGWSLVVWWIILLLLPTTTVIEGDLVVDATPAAVFFQEGVLFVFSIGHPRNKGEADRRKDVPASLEFVNPLYVAWLVPTAMMNSKQMSNCLLVPPVMVVSLLIRFQDTLQIMSTPPEEMFLATTLLPGTYREERESKSYSLSSRKRARLSRISSL